MKYIYLLKRKKDVKTIYLVVSLITDPNLVRGVRAGEKKKKYKCWRLKGCCSDTNFGSFKNYERIVFRAEVRVLEKLGEK